MDKLRIYPWPNNKMISASLRLKLPILEWEDVNFSEYLNKPDKDMNATWRDIAKPIIAETIAKYGCSNMHRLRKELNAVYPFHEKAMWPYKVWLDEIKVQTGTKKTKPKPPDEPLFALLQEQE